ncbi:tRNA (5-methylaminomethyl-2-thiouridine)(34)-methyltransferase MnmD [Psychroflexus sp. CAK1W]|uniref:tRNA (5-methylaminomethyl-2-thiouridine)(34)-methyltransferase MnmD n=1 Tax=Psychroflexus curvus TaxID=2873595 RepID=UPI001CCE0809|nr:tRNA (5-methylaminomethyl-2-thiouridine)(34)-methyltransferase MnmD [Psychroflexus curvus]MBZ9628112.1 tRNA (5-methylaminomethyl-2-thiouridine)(34)-methyltransferase MnmD [Psychroflexus curvus]
MKRSIVTTEDGSKTIRVEDWDEHYHSTHGAVQESRHVYIQAGLDFYVDKRHPQSMTVLEAGFGTGLNALLTCLWSQKSDIQLDYLGMEAFPVSEAERAALDYHKTLGEESAQELYEQLHLAEWEKHVEISKTFRLKKQKLMFSELGLQNQVDVVFYDAFGPRVQPELWEKSIFQNFYKVLKPGGIFVTYCVKGTARRALQEIGFEVDIIEGPPGKRHMMRAYK